MGELHIEIIHDRIRREYGIETHLGPLQVAYRETILNEVSTTGTKTHTHLKKSLWGRNCSSHQHTVLLYYSNADTLDRTVGERRHVATVALTVRPVDILSSSGSCEVALTEELEAQLSPDLKEAVENGAHSSYLQGITERNLIFLQSHPSASNTLRFILKFSPKCTIM